MYGACAYGIPCGPVSGFQGYNTQVGFGLSLPGLIGGAVDIFEGIFGGGPSQADIDRAAQSLLSQHQARPLQIPTMAANRVARNGDEFTVDELGAVYSRTPTRGALQALSLLGCTPEPTGDRVLVAQSLYGATAGTAVPIFRCRSVTAPAPGIPGPVIPGGISPWVLGAGVVGAGVLVYALSRRGRRRA